MKNKGSGRHRARGYSLIELVLALTLLSIFGLLANRLFMRCLTLNGQALSAGNRIAQSESLLSQLRADVWGATAIVCPEPTGVTLTQPDGSVVRWQMHEQTLEDEAQTWITRQVTQDGAEAQRDTLYAPFDLTFAAEGPDLYVIDDTQQVRLSSVLASRGGGG